MSFNPNPRLSKKSPVTVLSFKEETSAFKLMADLVPERIFQHFYAPLSFYGFRERKRKKNSWKTMQSHLWEKNRTNIFFHPPRDVKSSLKKKNTRLSKSKLHALKRDSMDRYTIFFFFYRKLRQFKSSTIFHCHWLQLCSSCTYNRHLQK